MVTTQTPLPAIGAQPKPLSVPQFARAIDRSERTVRLALRRGQLSGVRLGNRWLIHPGELARLVGGDAEGGPDAA